MEFIQKKMDAATFERLVDSGAARLKMKVQEVNDLNVFPIPDGDTGENMFLTIKGGVEAMHAEQSSLLTDKANALANGMLLNARGNSGVILSQLFFGLSEGLKEKETATLIEFSKALKIGVDKAYASVVHPVEETILTVAREAVENTEAKISCDTLWVEFFKSFLSEMKRSLMRTPELLEALKESGVIDSGGAGLVYIIEGFYKALLGEDFIGEIAATEAAKVNAIDFSNFNADSEMTFGYCTELLVQLQNSKVDVENFTVDAVKDYLSTIGDSIVAFKTGSIIKIHVHTMKPYKVLEYCHDFGEFLTVKIENMTVQHNESIKAEENEIQTRVKRSRRKFALIAVASGQGLVDMFKDLGADEVVSGGQTNNPSSEDFISAFERVNADYVFVLPNNSNVVLTAKQAANMYSDSKIIVIESKNIGQGYSIMSMLDYSSDDPKEIEERMKSDMAGVCTAMVSTAVRTTTVNGVNVNKDDFIGFTDHEMLVSNGDKIETAKALIDKLNLNEKEFFIVMFGKDSLEFEREEIANYVQTKFSAVEFYSIDGGQEVYDFIFVVE